MNSETEIEQDTFAASVVEGIAEDNKPPEKVDPPAKVDPASKVDPPAKVIPEKKDPAAKPELDNPNLERVEIQDLSEEQQNVKPKGMSDAVFIDFNKVRGQRNAATKERDALKLEIEPLRKQVAESAKITKELEEARKELAAAKEQLTGYESEITVTRVEATPKFKKEITGPMTEIKTSAEDIAKRYEVSPDILLRAIHEPDPAKAADLLEDATSEMKGVDRMELVQMARDYRRIQKNADELRKNAGQQLEAMTREQQQAQERVNTKTITDYRAAVAERFKALQERIPVIRSVEGKDDWNSFLGSKVKRIEAININDLEVGEVADMAAAREALPEVQKALEYVTKERDTIKAERDELKTRLAKFKKTEPAAGGGGNGSGPNGGRGKSYTSFEEAVGADV